MSDEDSLYLIERDLVAPMVVQFASSEESVGPLSTRIAAGSPARAAAGRRTAQRQLFLFVAGWLSNQLAFLVNATPSIEGNHNRRWATFRNRPSAGASVNSHEPVRI